MFKKPWVVLMICWENGPFCNVGRYKRESTAKGVVTVYRRRYLGPIRLVNMNDTKTVDDIRRWNSRQDGGEEGVF